MGYWYWKQGYTIYAPNETIIWHNYDRSYRPQFTADGWDKGEPKFINTYYKNGKRMREMIFGDEEYRRYMDERWGIDLLGGKGNKKAIDAGLDPYYFWDSDSGFYDINANQTNKEKNILQD